ncbi:unnamed protein product [Auanema sp. JU1783]|nr:unnamed protein product [Auanema sp. JU1783]
MTASITKILTFSKFCDVLIELKNADTMNSKGDIIKQFYENSRNQFEDEAVFLKQLEPIILLFLPDSNDTLKLDLGPKKLTDLILKTFDIRELRSVTSTNANEVTELLAREIIKRFTLKCLNLTLDQIYEGLSKISKLKGADREKELFGLIQNLSEGELVWFLNIMIRNIEKYAGYTRTMFLSHLSPNANTAWHMRRDLRSVLMNKFEDNEEREPDFYLGCNFSPMLLARLTIGEVEDQMRNLHGGFYLETKFDGEHVILHKNGDDYKWFTRNGKDFTMNYGSNKNEKLAAAIHSFFKPTLKQCILDCELMHYDEATGKLIRHLDHASDGIVLNYSNPQPGHRIVVVVFDLLYIGATINGCEHKDDLTITPLMDRVEIMNARLLKDNKGKNDRIFLAPRAEGSTAEDIKQFFTEAMEKREEGIAIKRKDSLYAIGKRNKRNGWFKLKDRFDMDLVMVGICPPKDERGMSFLLAAWDETSYTGKNLHVICKTFTGLSDMDRKKVLQDVRKSGPLLKEPPECLIGWTSDSTYEYFRSSDWLIVEVTAYGVRNGHLVDSVIRRIRTDKEICREDIDEYRVIRKYDPAKNASKPNKETGASITRKRITKKSVFEQSLFPAKKSSLDGPAVQSPLKDVCICVLQSFDSNLRTKCCEILEGFGANIVANANDDTLLLVAPSENHMVVTMSKKKNKFNIIKADWVLRCEKDNVVEPWIASDIIHEVADGFTLSE